MRGARAVRFSSSWSVLSQAAPILVAAPRFIAGSISLGVLMQTAQAFQQMTQALAWPIENMQRLAEARASFTRVIQLHGSLVDSRPEAVGRWTPATAMPAPIARTQPYRAHRAEPVARIH